YRIRGTQWTNYTTANGLASNSIHCLYVDLEGRLWIGTHLGIDCLSAGGFDHFGAREGLADGDVTCITEDHEGNLWAGAGIYLNRFAQTRFTPMGFGSRAMAQIGKIALDRNGNVLC